MTVRVQEPTPERDISGVEARTRQLARRPSPIKPGGVVKAWAWMYGGASSDVPPGNEMPVNFDPDLSKKYDPDDDVFEFELTDDGDTGNFRHRLHTLKRGIYVLDCRAVLNSTLVGTLTWVANEIGGIMYMKGFLDTEQTIWTDKTDLSIWPQLRINGLFIDTDGVDTDRTWDPYAYHYSTAGDVPLSGISFRVICFDGFPATFMAT